MAVYYYNPKKLKSYVADVVPKKRLFEHQIEEKMQYLKLYLWKKICHVKKFQISVKNFNILWSFIKIHAVFVLNLCGENLCGEKMTNMRGERECTTAL